MREQRRLVHIAFELWLRSHLVVFASMGPMKGPLGAASKGILGEKDE